ncbi:hypothetical protein F4780DRAFT_502358 [Xylariomycetidae sp. FL0641]|nr:hypothetical protein F4780DRAFT_502358 [Xylariomycetidae sp. FL0641]
MAETNNPMAGTSDATTISKTTLPIAGLLVDVYGLSELPPSGPVSCLWLHHPRLRKREDMAATAEAVLSAYHHSSSSSSCSSSSSAGSSNSGRGLLAVAFDQRNHGSRRVDKLANRAWRDGNPRHAQDMFATVSGTVADTRHLMDLLDAYVFPAGARAVDQHLVLGVSLGGHSAWQLMFAEPRVAAGVMVIGCPDYMNVMRDRARLTKLDSYSAADGGASFFGSADFPRGLVEACRKHDAKGILFGTGAVPTPLPAAEQDRLRPLLDARVKGKRFQVLSGGADKLVPYAAGVPFLEFFKDAAQGWYQDGNVYVEDNVYPEVGHKFDADMSRDAVRFILETVALADGDGKALSPRI